jgi:hypothetical protein
LLLSRPAGYSPSYKNRGDPSKLDALKFGQWQCRISLIELWRITKNGFKVVDSNNLTRREVVYRQLNVIVRHIIQIVMGSKDFPHIQHFSTTKEDWEGLSDVFVGNESMKNTIYEALSNQAGGLFMLDGEEHEEMYRRL